MSFLAEKEIPKSLLPPGNGELEAHDAIGMLKAYAFITEQASQESYDMHRLVQLAMRNWFEEKGELKSYATTAIQQLDKMFPIPNDENKDVWVRYLPYALVALEFRNYSSSHIAKSSLLYHAAEASLVLGKYQDAEKLYWQGLELWAKIFGSLYPNTLKRMNSVATSLDMQGKHRRLRPCIGKHSSYRPRYRSRYQPSCGPNYGPSCGPHSGPNYTAMSIPACPPYTAWRIRFTLKGKRRRPRRCFDRRSSCGLKSTVQNIPIRFFSVGALADVLHTQDKQKYAEELCRQTLELQTKVLGAEHSNTLVTMGTLAKVLHSQGK
ncbi:hypothetical protein VTI74DRAFT_8779 [Chaetomium olivicolor]